MDLNTITAVARPKARSELPVWAAGDAWLAGGTWLFSEPQAHLNRLIDLTELKWAPLKIDANGLSIAATCTIAQLDAMNCPLDWRAAPLINQCCRAFLASFKIWKTATVGGNLCMSLPAGPMISLTAALDAVTPTSPLSYKVSSLRCLIFFPLPSSLFPLPPTTYSPTPYFLLDSGIALSGTTE